MPDGVRKFAFDLDAVEDSAVAHFFNYVNVGTMPYVASFETLLPYYFGANSLNMDVMLYHLAKPQCLALLPLSRYAYDQTALMLKNRADPVVSNAIMRKMRVRHPPQKLMAIAPPPIGEAINFVFVGRQFFLKGGYEMLLTFERLKRKYDNFRLTVVSSLEVKEGWNVTQVTERGIAHAQQIMSDADYITWHEHLPNEQVMELILRSNAGLLPTYQETYGFSVLEMQACGVPVITTDIRALPEINSEDMGWMIKMPRRAELRAGTDPATVEKHKKANLQQLYAILDNIINKPDVIAAKGKRALTRIAKMHDPEEYKRDLRYFYSRKFYLNDYH